MPEITIIITAYKDRGWIQDAIDSAKKQTFKDYDIIFASDGNPWIENYAADNNIPFHFFEKSNYATLVNNAVKIATGKWIKVLHDDDMLSEYCLEDLHRASEGADMVYGNALCFKDDDIFSYSAYRPPVNVKFREMYIKRYSPVNFEAELINRESFINAGGFDTSLGYSEDYDMLLNFLARGYTVRHCDKYVVWYRHHERQITGNEPEMKAREQKYIAEKYIDVFAKTINWAVC